MLKLTKIVINPNGDSYDVWFIDDDCYMCGDYYHDKIDEVMDGFCKGLEFCNRLFKITTMRNFIFSLLILPFLHLAALADINDVNNSVCQIIQPASQHSCTGFCYKEDNENLYCLTCGHCYHEDNVNVSLTHNTETKQIVGNVVYHHFVLNSDNDVCIVIVKKKDFGDYPLLVPVKWATSTPKEGIMWTHGCSLGGWPSAFKGRILPKQNLDGSGILPLEYIYFSPAGKQGRSGSPIFNEKYELIGMLNMKLDINKVPQFGLGIPIKKLLEEINKYEQRSEGALWVPAP